MGIKDDLNLSELGTYHKVFPVLTVPTLGADIESHIETLAAASIEQIRFLNAFAGIPIEVLYENIGQRHKASNFMALSVLRKKGQDISTARGLDLIDVPDDGISGEYSNAFLPVKRDGAATSSVLLKGLLEIIGLVVGTFTGQTALQRVISVAVDWLQEGGFFYELALMIIDNIIEGVVLLIVENLTGKGAININNNDLIPYFGQLVTALQAANYKTEAAALVTAFGNEGALVTQAAAIKQQLADCCTKEALTDIATIVKDAKWKEANEEIARSLKEFEFKQVFELFDLNDEEGAWAKFTKELLLMLKELAYKTETLEIGGIRLALRATIIHE